MKKLFILNSHKSIIINFFYKNNLLERLLNVFNYIFFIWMYFSATLNIICYGVWAVKGVASSENYENILRVLKHPDDNEQ